MAHSNIYSYPLPFPNEVQRMQISSYSSPANALGTDPEEVYQQRRTPRTQCDTVTNTQAIYLDVPPISNPAYPYPARNVSSPGTYVERTPSSICNRGSTTSSILGRNENSDQNDFSAFPSGYDCLPQPLMEPQAAFGFPAIHFLRRGHTGPYSLWDLLTNKTMPDLVAGDLPIVIHSPEHWIDVKLIWPGYSRYPFEKRILINQGGPLTLSSLLMMLAIQVGQFAWWIHREGVVVEPGQEHWTITGGTGGGPELWQDCVITSLQHRAGSIWRPEIYFPTEF